MKKIIYLALILAIAAIAYSTMSGSDDPAYIQQIADERAERVRYLKTSESSPFQQYDLDFYPLEFFQIDPAYRVRANLERIQSPSRISIPSSDGSSAPYSKFAYAHFTLDGQKLKLLILKPAGFGAVPNTYFTAFADATSGETTYGGGRYLDLDIGKSDNIIIDFNNAYNPYCAYTSEYACPLPPPENLLPVAVAAGEKDYNH
ncbi:DUF1684 domain-containing protein [Marinoscillum furvescens]|uniref:DUF1684 domain-containing protein n=1 Tax=Marinoscillum furvescens DSM 4134 TaxID=1122208 RepID=A0A3D9KX19_MARFU|nr:DUF1684 domain-containing protein [Marinoscillum furvescens]RED92817.1 hypothetical protein C7460_12834 [Marinoscillum furvescens DSM 4134]